MQTPAKQEQVIAGALVYRSWVHICVYMNFRISFISLTFIHKEYFKWGARDVGLQMSAVKGRLLHSSQGILYHVASQTIIIGTF